MRKRIYTIAIMLWGLCLLGTGCSDMIADQEAGQPAVTRGSNPVMNLSGTPGPGNVTLTWTDPTAAFDHIEVTWSPDGSAAQTVAAGAQTFTATGLVSRTTYIFTVRVVLAGGSSGGDAAISTRTPTTIATAAEMNDVRNDLSDSYILIADIDLSGYAAGDGWVPIGDFSAQFTGTLDGNGHTISNLTINRSGSDNQGLFGFIGSGGTVTNLGLTGGSVTGNSYVGSLAAGNYGTVSSCYTTGAVKGGFVHTGGLLGTNSGTVSGCYATGTVTGGSNIGGLVGGNYGTVSRCYATGTVSGSAYIGGLVGGQYFTSNSLSNCYATGNVSGNQSVGGLLGGPYGSISNCYALGLVSGTTKYGGLIGEFNASYGSVSASYYDKNTTGQSDTGKGDPKSTTEMQDPSTYSGWNFTAIWRINPSGYPYLR